MKWIQTVCGVFAAGEVTTADSHEHLRILPGVRRAPVLVDEEGARAELRDFATAGGNLVVDCQPGGIGRDGASLARLGASSGVAVVAVTGFHLARYYAPDAGPWGTTADLAAVFFRRELSEGLDEAPWVLAGAIKTAWTGQGGREVDLMRAAFGVARDLGVGVIAHTEAGGHVEALVKLADGVGILPGKLQLSHIDKRPDFGLHRELAQAGYLLGYDTFLRPKYAPDQRVWPLLRAMVAEGLEAQVTLGLDVVDVALWHVYGGPGLRTIPTTILARLRAEGASDEQLRAVGGQNIARLLARDAAQ
ncbi:MAG: hypothetical protein NVSMB22_10230 [Chloroflexota bacterium]